MNMGRSCTPICKDCGHLMSSHKDGKCKRCGCILPIDYRKLWEICCRCEAPGPCDADYEFGYYMKHGKFPCKTLNDEYNKVNNYLRE